MHYDIRSVNTSASPGLCSTCPRFRTWNYSAACLMALLFDFRTVLFIFSSSCFILIRWVQFSPFELRPPDNLLRVQNTILRFYHLSVQPSDQSQICITSSFLLLFLGEVTSNSQRTSFQEPHKVLTNQRPHGVHAWPFCCNHLVRERVHINWVPPAGDRLIGVDAKCTPIAAQKRKIGVGTNQNQHFGHLDHRLLARVGLQNTLSVRFELYNAVKGET